MVDISPALQDWAFIAKRLKGILDYLPELEAIAHVEDTIKAREQRLVELGLKEDEKKADIKKLLQDVEDVKNLKAQKVAEAEKAAQVILDQAKASAEHIINPIRKEHASLNDSAQGLKVELGRLQTERAGLSAVVDSLSHQKGTLEQQVLNLQSKLRNIKDSIDG